MNSSETLNYSAGGSANVLKFVKVLELWYFALLLLRYQKAFCVQTWSLGSFCPYNSNHLLNSWKSLPSWGTFPFPSLDAELAGGVCWFVFTVFHFFPKNSLSISWAPALSLCSLMPDQFQEQRSSPDVLILCGFAHTRDVQTPISYLWNSLWHRGVFSSCQQFAQGWLPAVVFSFLPPAATLTIGTAAGGKNERTRLKEALCHCCNFEIDGVF